MSAPVNAVSLQAPLDGRSPELALPQLEQPKEGTAQAGEQPGGIGPHGDPVASASPAVAGSGAVTETEASDAQPMDESDMGVASALIDTMAEAVLMVERKEDGFEKAGQLLSKADFKSLKATILASKVLDKKEKAGQGQAGLHDTYFTYFRLQLTPVPMPKASSAPPAKGAAQPAAAQATPNCNAQMELAMYGRLGPAQLKAARKLIFERALRALFTGTEGFPVTFRRAFTRGGGGPLPDFLDEGCMRVRNEDAPLLLGTDLQGTSHVFPDEQGIQMAVNLIPMTAPHKRVLTMVSGLPTDITTLEVFAFFRGLLRGNLDFTDVRRSESWAAPLASSSAGDGRLRLETLAHQCINWSPPPCQPSGGAPVTSGSRCAYYVTSRHDDASRIPSRFVMTRLEGTFAEGSNGEVTLACTGEAVRGCSCCGAIDHPTASCSGRGVGRPMPRFNEEGVRLQATVPLPPAPGSSAGTSGSDAPDGEGEWQEARGRKASRKAPHLRAQAASTQRGQQGRPLQHQQGRSQQSQRRRPPKQTVHPTAGRGAPSHRPANPDRSGHRHGASIPSGARFLASSVHPKAILKHPVKSPQQAAGAMEVDCDLPPASRTLSGLYLDAASRSSPNKPAIKRPLPSPFSAKVAPAQPGPRHTVPDQAEAAEHLGLNAAPSNSGDLGNTSPALGVLCHAQQQAAERPVTRPRLESSGTPANASSSTEDQMLDQ